MNSLKVIAKCLKSIFFTELPEPSNLMTRGYQPEQLLSLRDPRLLQATMPWLELFYQCYFRVTSSGWENMPLSGSFLLVGSHNGGKRGSGYVHVALRLAASFWPSAACIWTQTSRTTLNPRPINPGSSLWDCASGTKSGDGRLATRSPSLSLPRGSGRSFPTLQGCAIAFI